MLNFNPHHTVSKEFVEFVHFLNEKDSDGNTCFHRLLENGETRIKLVGLLDNIKSILLCINEKNNKGQTPLHLAAIKDASPHIIEQFIRFGADVNAKDNNGMTPLYYNVNNWSNFVHMSLLGSSIYTARVLYDSSENRIYSTIRDFVQDFMQAL